MGRWELICELSRADGASEDGREAGGGGNCCSGSALAGMAMAGAEKPTEATLSATDTDWFSTGSAGFSFPGVGAGLDSVLLGWMGGCEMVPTGC